MLSIETPKGRSIQLIEATRFVIGKVDMLVEGELSKSAFPFTG
jgi:hypothetical protein